MRIKYLLINSITLVGNQQLSLNENICINIIIKKNNYKFTEAWVGILYCGFASVISCDAERYFFVYKWLYEIILYITWFYNNLR